MPTNNSNDDFDNELLSAYVDDELSPREREQVEERLRVDPHARQLVEELCNLSSAIRSLPRETLGRDLRASIQAEALRVKDDADHSPLTTRQSPTRASGYRRGLVWSTVAIAAALMLMVFQPEDADRDVRGVAQVDRKEEMHRENRRGGVAVDGTLPPQGEMRAFQPPEDAAKPIDAVAQVPGSADKLAEEAATETDDLAAAPTTIELAFVTPDAVARFERLLSEHEILLEAEPAADAAFYGDKQLSAQTSPASAEKAEKADAAVQVLVEASPAQIDALVAACQSDKSSFAYVRVPKPLSRQIANRGQSTYPAENAQLADSAPQSEPLSLPPRTSSELKRKNRDVATARAWRHAALRDAEPRNRAAPLPGHVRILFVLRPEPLPAAEPPSVAP